MKLTLKEIEQALLTALAEFKILHGEDYDISDDLYWTIPYPQKLSVYENPTPLLGSLADHVQSIKRSNAGDEQPPETLLEDLGEVLKYLSNTDFKVSAH